MALYEITYLTKEESDPGVRALIEQSGGTITEESSLGRRKLAYPINKETQAVYSTFVFDIEKPALDELNRKLRLNKNVMRYLVVVKDIAKANKEVTKAVREAIAAAEKLEDTPFEAPATPAAEPVVEEAPVEETAPAVEEVAVETVETPAEEQVEEAPKKRAPRAKKAEPADAAEATEEDRLKALEDKLSDILKD